MISETLKGVNIKSRHHIMDNVETSVWFKKYLQMTSGLKGDINSEVWQNIIDRIAELP